MQTDELVQARPNRAERFGSQVTTWVHDRLPARLQSLLPPDFIGFALLGLCTFIFDLTLMSALRLWMPLWFAVGSAYLVSFWLNFLLNRTLNFRSHAPVGGQVLRFCVVLLCDYSLTVGGTTGLTEYLGVDFRIARMLTGCCVALFTYVSSRYWVFVDRSEQPES